MIRRLAAVLSLVILLSACGSSGEPRGFDEQPVRLSDELRAALDIDAEFLPVVERNFLEGCALGERPRIDGASNLGASCRCAYDGIVAFYRENSSGDTPESAEAAAYDSFKQLDKALQSETGVIPANIQSILDGCAT